MKFKKGDKVKVWSLQSWSGGGFLNGEEAVVTQNQVGDSVILAVVRKIDSKYMLDISYEVYAKQCEPLEYSNLSKDSSYDSAKKELINFWKKLVR